MAESRHKRKPTKEEKEKIETAASRGDLNTLQLLHKEGVDVTGVVDNAFDITSLHYAALNGHYNMVSSLLNWGSEVNAVDVHKQTPLHMAAHNGHTDVVTLLLDNRADINMKNWYGRTPLEVAVLGNKPGVVYHFIKVVGMDPTQYDQRTQQKIKQLLEEEIRSNPTRSPDPQQATPQNVLAGVQQLKLVDNYQQQTSQRRRGQPQHQPQQQLHQQQEQTQQLQLQINNLSTQFQALQATVTREQEKSKSLERRCQSLESALTAEQEKSKSLESRSQSLESALASEQETSRSLVSALTAEQEKFQSLEARCQTVETNLNTEQQRFQNHEERLKEVEDTVERLWSISRDELNLTNKIIGTGGWGYVTEADFRGRRVAAKCLHAVITSQHNQQLFAKEMKIFARCRHRNLLEFIGAVPDHPAIIVTELMDTNLREALSNGSATPNHIHPICMHVAQALSYLHGIQPHPLIHRDVSAPNVLLKAVNTGWVAKLSDLGSAQFANIAQTLAPGCVVYAAPEVRQESSARNQTTKMDVYSYGVLLIEVLTRQMPIGEVVELITAIQPTWPRFVPLIRRCTTNEPSRRPTMNEVISMLNTITI